MDDDDRERHINIHFSPEIMAGVYANFANVSHSEYEFTITFARVDHEVEEAEIPGVVVSKVALSPRFMRELIEALEDEAMVYSMWAVLRVMDMAALALQQGQWGRERERAQAAVRAWADRRAMELESEHRQHAALSLGAIADPRAIEPLFERVPDGDLQALELLADIGTPEIVVRLSAMLAELADDAAVMVAQTLGQIGDPACIPALEARLADTDSSARWAATPPPIRELLSRSSQVRSGR